MPVGVLAVTVMLAGQVITGAGFEVVVVVVAELLAVFGSLVTELTVAVLLMTVPLATVQLAVATRVAVTLVPGAIVAKVTVRALPDPPQVPPPVAEQLTKVTLAGRVSETVTLVAVAGPALVTVMV